MLWDIFEKLSRLYASWHVYLRALMFSLSTRGRSLYKFSFVHVLYCGLFSSLKAFAHVLYCGMLSGGVSEALYVLFSLVPILLSFYLFWGAGVCLSFRFAHDRCWALCSFYWGIMCFCLSCVEPLPLSLGTETSHFKRSVACLFTWLLDLLNELLLLFFLLIFFYVMNLCWVMSMHWSRGDWGPIVVTFGWRVIGNVVRIFHSRCVLDLFAIFLLNLLGLVVTDTWLKSCLSQLRIERVICFWTFGVPLAFLFRLFCFCIAGDRGSARRGC